MSEKLNRVEREQQRAILRKAKELEITLKRVELVRIGLDPFDSKMAVDDIFTIARKYDDEIRLLDAQDAQEDYTADNPFPYEAGMKEE